MNGRAPEVGVTGVNVWCTHISTWVDGFIAIVFTVIGLEGEGRPEAYICRVVHLLVPQGDVGLEVMSPSAEQVDL